jgi:signal peptidase I
MDVNEKPKTYPRGIGLLLAFLLPGAAHFLSGKKGAGIAWFFGLLSLGVFANSVIAAPLKAAVVIGLLLKLLVFPILFIVMCCKSYRPVRRLRVAGWLGFLLVWVAVNGGSVALHGLLPAIPFKIPTGAMQPTLRGIVATNEMEDTSVFSWIPKGRAHKEFIARASGKTSRMKMGRDGLQFAIGEVEHVLPTYVAKTFWPKKQYEKGEAIWSGTVYSGDHIMVDRLSYLFGNPKRGDIVVFSTDGIDHKQVRQNTVFVKRIVGLPGETIRIKPPNLVVDGRLIHKPVAFRTLHYSNEGKLSTPEDSIVLDHDEYLVFGDNTARGGSLDGRFFGAIHRNCIIGKVSTIYWPFNRIGAVE